MKKILALAMVLAMFAALVACEASKGDLTSINDYVAPNYTYETETGYFTFAEAGGNTAIITSYVGKPEAHAVDIPAQVTVASLDENAKDEDNIRNIIGIADRAFYYCTAMTSVTIPKSVETIGKWAFAGCTGLTEIEIPDKVVSIGEGAFHGCSNIQSISLSTELVKIDDYAFYGCTGLTSIEFPDKLQEIGSGAFFGCTGFTTLNLPASVTIIEDNAFYQCTTLKEVTINATANDIAYGKYVFWSGLVDEEKYTFEHAEIPEGYVAIGAFLVTENTKAAEFVRSIVVSGIGGPTTDDSTTEAGTTEPEATTEADTTEAEA